MTRDYRIATIPGDGIGREVVPAAATILDRAGALFGFGIEWTEFDWSCAYYAEHGRMMPADGLDQLRDFDQIFLGAVGSPEVPDDVSLWGLLIPIRRAFQQYINLRPVTLLPGMTSPLREDVAGSIDFLVVRENNEGEYSEIGGRLYRGTPQEIAVQEAVFTRIGVERTMRYAFGLAKGRRGNLASATKSNGIIHTMPFWDEVFRDISAEYPDVDTSPHHIDALAAKFVLAPSQFDVVVASNLFGDILTDIGAAIIGSIGIGASGNINPERDFPSMFESVHGSAPDIAGRGIANPLGQVWAGSMMLEHMGEAAAAAAITEAMSRTLLSDVRTPDLGGTATTTDVTQALIASLEEVAR
jgi:tartrate dehydrogenase/decarboxylase/D-malate dehydrogenase